MTMKMINDSQPGADDTLEIDGDTINDIIVVGRLIEQKKEAMRTTFGSNDNTGFF